MDLETFLLWYSLSLILLTAKSSTDKYSENEVNAQIWCVTSEEAEQKCRAMANAFHVHNLKPRIQCVIAESTLGCMQRVSDGRADITTVPSLQVGLASRRLKLIGIMAENYPHLDSTVEPLDHYALALVWADSNVTMDSLKGSRSCHSSIREASGWDIPVSVLLEKGLMSPLDCTSPAISAANFFSQSCVPGISSEDSNPRGLNLSNLCALCGGSDDSHCKMERGEIFYGEPGAFRCLTGLDRNSHERRADVAFLRHDTVLKMTVAESSTDDSNLSNLDRLRLFNKRKRSEFALLCADGGRAIVEDYRDCNWGKVASNLVMVFHKNKHKEETVDMLLKGQELFADDYRNYFKMFDSSQLGISQSDLIFRDRTVRLTPISKSEALHWTRGMDDQLANLYKCPLEEIRWCVFSFSEMEKCSQISTSMLIQNYNWHFRLKCIMQTDIHECFRAIQMNEADLISSDPSLALLAVEKYQLEPVASINTSLFQGRDYAILITKRNSAAALNNIQRNKIDGLCLPWVGSTPYLFFVHFLKNLSFQGKTAEPKTTPCDYLDLVQKKTMRACVPGLTDYFGSANPQLEQDLCGLCATSSSNLCEANHDNIYFDQVGAFRCMAEEFPDMAVTTYNVLFDNTNMETYTEWNWNLRRSLYHLVCANLTSADTSFFRDCNLGEIPPHVVLSRRNTSSQIRNIYFNFLRTLDSCYTSKEWEKKAWVDSVFRGNQHANLMFPETGRNFVSLPRNYSFQNFPEFEKMTKLFIAPDISQYRQCSSAENLFSKSILAAVLMKLIQLFI